MRTISSIRTAALVVALVVIAYSQRAELRPPPSQDQTTMKAFGPDAVLLVIDMLRPGHSGEFATVVDTKRILDAVHAGADLEGRQS